MKKQTPAALLVPAAALLASLPASAALLTIGPSTDTFSTPASNNVLGAGTPMIDRATLSTTGPVRLSFYFLGSESGYRNTLNLPGPYTHTEPDNAGQAYPSPWGSAVQLASFTVAAAGPVPMYFTSSGWTTGFQLHPGPGTPARSIAFAYLDCVTGPGCAQATNATNMVLFALDDDGANIDDNHDDYVGYMVASPVPLPASVWLLGSALLGLLGIGRRRKAS